MRQTIGTGDTDESGYIWPLHDNQRLLGDGTRSSGNANWILMRRKVRNESVCAVAQWTPSSSFCFLQFSVWNWMKIGFNPHIGYWFTTLSLRPKVNRTQKPQKPLMVISTVLPVLTGRWRWIPACCSNCMNLRSVSLISSCRKFKTFSSVCLKMDSYWSI